MKKINNEIFISGFSDEISSEFDKQIKVVKENNMNYISLRNIDGKNIGEYSIEEFEEKVLPKLEKNNVKVSSIGSPVGKIFIDDEEGYKKHLKILEKLCRIAEILETKYIRIFSFYIKEGEHDKYKKDVGRKLKNFVQIAENKGIILIHENEKDIYGDTFQRCREIISQVNSPNFKAAFDFANFVQCGEDTLKAYETLKDDIVYIHIKDANYNTSQNVVCGMGEGKIKEILYDIILKENYKGFLTLEPHLVQFDGLKNLELGNVDEIIKNEKNLTGKEGYVLQYKALIKLLNELGVD